MSFQREKQRGESLVLMKMATLGWSFIDTGSLTKVSQLG